MVVECKSEVELKREDILKTESGQMNNACAWFSTHYSGAKATNVMIIPAFKTAKGAGFNMPVMLLREKGLSDLVAHTRNFVKEFKTRDLKNLSAGWLQKLLSTHQLSVDDLVSKYTVPPKVS